MNRNIGLLAVILSLGALFYATVAQLLPVIREAPPAPQASMGRVKGEELDPDRLGRLAASMREAVTVSASNASIALASFGYEPPKPIAPRVRRAAEPMPLELSLVYETGNGRYALVNGKLYRQGQRLPSGETLVRVATDRITVANRAAAREVAMDVGRLYRQDRQSAGTTPGLASPVLFRLPVGETTPQQPEETPRERRDFAGEASLDILVSHDPQ